MDMPVYPGDPLTPGVGATKDAKRLAARRTHDPHQDSRAADLLRRRAAAAGRARRPDVARSLARRAAHSPITSARAQRRCTSRSSSTGTSSRSTTSSPAFPARAIPTSGSSAATITTPGSTAPRIPISGAGRPDWRKRARSASCCKQGWKPKRTIIYCVWDGEEPACSAPPNGPRPRRRIAAARRGLHQLRRQRPRLPRRRRLAHARELHQRRGARHPRSGNASSPSGSVAVRWQSPRAHAEDDRKEIRGRADLRIGALGSGSDYTVVPRPPRHRRR